MQSGFFAMADPIRKLFPDMPATVSVVADHAAQTLGGVCLGCPLRRSRIHKRPKTFLCDGRTTTDHPHDQIVRILLYITECPLQPRHGVLNHMRLCGKVDPHEGFAA